MSKTKNLLKFLLNPWLCILLYFAASLFAMGWFAVKPVKKIVVKTFILKEQQETKVKEKKEKTLQNDAIKKKV